MIKIGFTGDVFLNPKNNCGCFSVSDELLEKWSLCNCICINMEGPVLLGGSGRQSDKKGPCIYQDSVRLKSLTDVPNAVFDLANNHIMDYGKRGLTDTISFIGEDRCFGAGDSCYKELVINSDNSEESVSILAVAESGFGCQGNGYSEGYAWFDAPAFWDKLGELKKIHSAVIVVAHAGLEDENIPLPELRQLYRRYIDHGADAVIAHHPHVIQGRETYRGKDIYYSLGNAVFEQLGTGEPYNSESISVTVDIQDGTVSTNVIPIQYSNGVLKESDDAITIFEAACRLLEDDKLYMDAVNKMCIKHYRNEYTEYYKAIFGRRGRIKNLILSILYLFGKECFDETMLFHNIMIETHYWCVRRALRLIREKKEANENTEIV